jgi:acyl carrier protein
MEKQELLLLLDDLVGEEPGVLVGKEQLADIEGWDSLASVGFIALVDEYFEIIVSPKRLQTCTTVNDLIDLLNGHITE